MYALVYLVLTLMGHSSKRGVSDGGSGRIGPKLRPPRLMRPPVADEPPEEFPCSDAIGHPVAPAEGVHDAGNLTVPIR